MENLLRVARSETAGGTAFAALLGDGSAAELVSVPAAGTPEGLSSEELTELVRQASADPEFAHARVFVRSVRSAQMGQTLTVAVAPLRDGQAHSMIGVVAGPDHRFEAAQLDVLERLAQRLLRHLQVVQKLSDGEGLRREPLEPAASGAPNGAASSAPNGVGSSPAWAASPGGAPEVPAEIPPGAAAERPPGAAAERPPDGPAEAFSGASEASEATWWAEPDPRTGLSSLGQFFSRAGRMLVPDDRATGALALVVVEVPDPRTAPCAARGLRGQLRFSDPLTRVDRDLFAVAIVLFPAGSGDVVEQRLASAVRSVIARPDAVRTVHVVARPGDRRDVDELLREAVSRLPGRS